MFSKDNVFIAIILINVLITSILCVSEAELYSEILHRNRRQLLFPNSTLLQFNAGVGTPSLAKNLNVNWAFQANFQLPWNRTQIPMDILVANSGYDGESRKKRDLKQKTNEERDGDYEDDAKLYHFYKYIEDTLTSYGHNGTTCVLRTLCQLGAEPLHSDDEEDLLHELASFVLNPTNDIDHHYTEKNEAYPYIEAYRNGQKSEDCIKLYSTCTISLVDIFSNLYSDHK